jgi:hypothetical protein
VPPRESAAEAACPHNHFTFRAELEFGDEEARAAAGLTGISTGAPLSFSKKTTNFAGFVLLALRPTVWMSSGPS